MKSSIIQNISILQPILLINIQATFIDVSGPHCTSIYQDATLHQAMKTTNQAAFALAHTFTNIDVYCDFLVYLLKTGYA